MADAIATLKGQEKKLLAYILKRARNPRDAEDYLQETLLRVMDQSRKREIENPMAYAYRVADTVLYADARKMGQEVEIGDEDYACETPLADEQLEYKQRVDLMFAAIEELPDLRRTIFIKRHIDGLSRAQIASSLGISVEAVKKNLVRAMASLSSTVALDANEFRKHK